MDSDRENKIRSDKLFKELVGTIKGERKRLIETIYNLLTEGSQISLEDLEDKYTPARAPIVECKARTASSLREEFEDTINLYCYQPVYCITNYRRKE